MVAGVTMLAAVALVFAFLLASLDRSRSRYFQDKDLTELDRVAQNLSSTSAALDRLAPLHFVPGQLHFSYNPARDCLIAETNIASAGGLPAKIVYRFPRPAPKPTGKAVKTATAAATPAIDRCTSEAAASEGLSIDPEQVLLVRRLQPRELVYPIAPRRPGGDAFRDAWTMLKEGARKELAELPTSAPPDASTLLDDSFAAAEKQGVVARTSVPSQALDLSTALQRFDGVRVIGPAAQASHGRPMLLEAGAVPPEIDLADSASTATFIATVFDQGQHPQPQADRPAPASAQDTKLPPDSRVYPAGNMLVFERSYPRLAGFGCAPASPCLIVGVVANARFNEDVRKLEGLPLTWFLIAAVTLAALVPLLYLTLLKRLDPIGLRGQYLIWFSLTLLAASAAIASLTIWGVAASRAEGKAYADATIARLQRAFKIELHDSLLNLAHATLKLKRQDSQYPAPQPGGGFPTPGPNAALLDSVDVFGGGGLPVIYLSRFAATQYPAFGTNISDRPYFTRAQEGAFSTIPAVNRAGDCPSGSGAFKFIIDRVFARPDGVAKTLFLVPLGQPCLSTPADVASPSDAGPSDPKYLVATGQMQTFLAAATAPGFRYAVIDPGSAPAPFNILYASRKKSELSESFERDVDASDRRAFTWVLGRIKESGGAKAEASDLRPVSFPTYFRGDPVVLHLARLHPSLRWVLVVIEQRKDPGFALWHAASFGYVAWLIAILLAALLAAIAQLLSPRGLDRRPGLWLWPRRVFDEFTAPRFDYEAWCRDTLPGAAEKRDLHILAVLTAGAVGVLAAEGSARVMMAFAAVMSTFASRAYFGGSTAPQARASRRLDRLFVGCATALAVLAGLLMLAELMSPAPWNGTELSTGGRPIVFALALVALVPPLWFAARHARAKATGPASPARTVGAAAGSSGRSAVLLQRLRSSLLRAPGLLGRRGRIGWALVLIAVGALPAAAGFLDSIDHSASLVEERRSHHLIADGEERQKALAGIASARERQRPQADTENRVRKRILPGEADKPDGATSCPLGEGRPEPAAAWQWDYSLSERAVSYLGLEHAVLEHSDHCKLHFRDGWAALVGGMGFPLLLGVLFPFVLLALAYYHFRRQYFLPAPLSPVTARVAFHPPLTCDREDFIDLILAPAARGGPPRVPFDGDLNRRHLILGAPADLKDDEALKEIKPKQWIDLLDIAIDDDATIGPIDEDARLILVDNLDLVLQMNDAEAAKRVLKELQQLAKQVPPDGTRYLFILAEIEPLDRIALLRARKADSPDAKHDDWKWARLLEDFSLLVIVPPGVIANPSAAEKELSVLDTRFARSLCKQLNGQLGAERGPAPSQADVTDRADASERIAEADGADEPDGADEADEADEADGLVDYIAEQMGDYYHRLWIASSNEERVLLYHIAWRRHLKLEDGPALRSLLVRGLVVRTPEYRLMNKSFARYVRRIERPGDIQQRAARTDNGTDSIWPLVRLPIIGLAAALLIMVQLLSPQQVTASVGLFPAIGALLPALLGTWLRQPGRAA